MPFTPVTIINGTTPANATNMGTIQTQYTEAVNSILQALLIGTSGGGFFLTGSAPFKSSPATKLTLPAGAALTQQTDGTLRYRSWALTNNNTATPSTTYYLDLNPDGTFSWGTSHSGVTNYLTVCTVTTDGSGNIATVTDTRYIYATLLLGMIGSLTLPPVTFQTGVTVVLGDFHVQGRSQLDHGNLNTDGLGSIKAGYTGGTPAALSLAAVAGSGLGIGVYKYKVTWISTLGQESTLSASSSITTTSGNQKVNVNSIPLGPTNTYGRNIYRTSVGGSDYLLVATIADNTTTTYADSVADGSRTLAPYYPFTHPSLGGVGVWNAGATPLAVLMSDGSVYLDSGLFTSDGAGNVNANSYASAVSATSPDPGAGGTISTTNGVECVTPASSRTGVILAAGTVNGQEVVVINESAANSIQFAASGTSHVADGTSDTIAALTSRTFVWRAATNLWYRMG